MKTLLNIIVFFTISILLITGCVPDTFKEEKKIAIANDWKEKSRAVQEPLWQEALDSVIYYNPSDPEPYYIKSVRQFRKGKMIDGIRNLEIAAKLDPFNYLNYLGFIHMLYLHDYERAEEIFKVAIDNNIHEDIIIAGSAYMRLGIVQLQQKKYKEAIGSFDRDVDKFGEKNVYNYTFVYRGIAKSKLGDHQGALKDFDKAIDLWNKCPEALYQKALLLMETGRKKEACRTVQKALLNKGFIWRNPHRNYILQLYESDIESLFDQTCR